MYIASIIINSISLVFHGFLIYYLFEAFKEFKAILKGHSTGQSGGYMELSREEPREERQRFPGRGVSIG